MRTLFCGWVSNEVSCGRGQDVRETHDDRGSKKQKRHKKMGDYSLIWSTGTRAWHAVARGGVGGIVTPRGIKDIWEHTHEA